jgi:hypothetical protein
LGKRKFLYFLVAVMVISVIALPGCVQAPSVTTPAASPTASEPAIPASYKTYTDETALFSISYPQDWETARSVLEEVSQSTKDAIKKIDENLPVDKASLLFFGGLVAQDGGYVPNVNVLVEPLPKGIRNHDQVAEGEVKGIKAVTKEYQELSRIKTTISGREATILEYTGSFFESSKAHIVQMFVYRDSTIWVVSCTSSMEGFDKWQGDFNSIVRSLRILK